MSGNTATGGGRRGSRWRVSAWVTAAALLLLPLFAMQITDEVVWTAADFAVAGVLLATPLVSYELAARKTGNIAYRAAVAVGLAAAFLLIWVNAAVGVIGAAGDDANLMYVGVVAVAMIGAITARFQPNGMARASLAAALAQVLVAVIALAAGSGSTRPNWPWTILLLTAFFVALWLLSARLFRHAAREQTPAGASQ